MAKQGRTASTDFEAVLYRAAKYIVKGRREKASRMCKKLLKNPALSLMLQAKAHIYLTTALDQNEPEIIHHAAEAARCSREAINTLPGNASTNARQPALENLKCANQLLRKYAVDDARRLVREASADICEGRKAEGKEKSLRIIASAGFCHWLASSAHLLLVTCAESTSDVIYHASMVIANLQEIIDDIPDSEYPKTIDERKRYDDLIKEMKDTMKEARVIAYYSSGNRTKEDETST